MARRVGYTTGVFDMFHAGHLNILRKAREHCDHLIVGVAGDELSVERKGKLPVVPFVERMAIVQHVRYVDTVVPYVNTDRMQAWRDLKFDVFFKGDDWRGTAAGDDLERAFKEVGVDVVYFPYTPNLSSTLLRQRIGQD